MVRYFFIPGKEESANDCLKSLMAIYLFRHKIGILKDEHKVDFTTICINRKLVSKLMSICTKGKITVTY